MPGKVHYRNFSPMVRAEGDEYIFEGYAATWDSIDSYDTSFKKGAFKKTIAERGDRIKILWNHDQDEPIGKIIEIREDDKGLFVRGLLTQGVSKAEDVFKNLKAEVIDTLSFGFDPLGSRKIDGRKQFTEVKLYEVSPVTFEANETAQIIDVRDDDLNKGNSAGDPEARSEDFNESLDDVKTSQGQWILTDALFDTLRDIWWNSDEDDIISKLDAALEDFHAAYLKWAADYIGRFWETRKLAMSRNDLSKAFITENTRSMETMSQETSFTMEELRALSSGEILPKESRHKLAELPESIRSAHQKERSRVVETLCGELRAGGFSNAEKMRFDALLGLKNEPDTMSPIVQLENIRKRLNK